MTLHIGMQLYRYMKNIETALFMYLYKNERYTIVKVLEFSVLWLHATGSILV